ncbi:two-component system, CitB family, sensor kinase/two-component system, CitB family, sensor histidine kinase MalK [Kushneria avicenniae]|uniref:histidine kinase n=1 Tax=Kushneria avicenniae TaxID=402385 RepID=A0A1I1KYB2_9GAMM|nr:ATP-binding protein [Kushneria avicenniae]SFC63123.1 two-component system, CitB family, sensor kinase/two-component system, CitB family, sensor histidine kinase MalK [Kushneria avicenniae]
MNEHPWPRKSPVRLNTLAALLAFITIMASLIVAYAVFGDQLWRGITRVQQDRVVNVATTLANSREVIEALEQNVPPMPDSDIEQRMESLRALLNVNFIVIINPQSIRLTHPNRQWIGHHFRGGDEGPALEGKRYASLALGTLGTSIRGFAPVRDSKGHIIGAVSVGVTLSHLAPLRAASLKRLLFLFLAILLIGGLGSAWLARTIRRRLMGMEPDDIARLVAERRVTLDAIHEGVIAVDAGARVTLINPAARLLLGDPEAHDIVPGKRLEVLLPGGGSAGQALGDRAMINRRMQVGGRAFLGNYQPMMADGQLVGAVVTFRDSREMQALAEELTGVRRYAEALRATTHEFKNKLHVILGLAQLEDLPALRRYLRELVDYRHAVSASIVERVREPVLAGFLIGKQSEAREKGITLSIEAETAIPAACDGATVHALVSIIGNLLENAFEALDGRDDPHVAIHMALESRMLSLQIQDNGTGIEPDRQDHIFEHGISSKGEQRGLGLYLVREQIDAVEGTLSLYSSPGQGTLIEISYPYRPANTRGHDNATVGQSPDE